MSEYYVSNNVNKYEDISNNLSKEVKKSDVNLKFKECTAAGKVWAQDIKSLRAVLANATGISESNLKYSDVISPRIVGDKTNEGSKEESQPYGDVKYSNVKNDRLNQYINETLTFYKEIEDSRKQLNLQQPLKKILNKETIDKAKATVTAKPKNELSDRS